MFMTSPLSRDVWIALERRFMDQSAAQEMQLRFDLQNLQKGTKPMATYLRELKAICDALAAINAPVLNKDMVIHALAGLPYEYESFTTTITKMNANITFADFRTKLLHQEQLPEGHCLLRYSSYFERGVPRYRTTISSPSRQRRQGVLRKAKTGVKVKAKSLVVFNSESYLTNGISISLRACSGH